MSHRLFVVSMVSALVFASVSLSSAEEKNGGLGVDVSNQSYELLSFDVAGSPFYSLTHTSLSPCFLVSFRANPNFWIEPSFGFRRSTEEQKNTAVTPNLTDKFTARDIKIGIGVLYLSNPSAFVSPFFRGKIDIHWLNSKVEEDVTFPSAGTDKTEFSATAFVLAGSIGGAINIKDAVFITLEGRLLWGSVGDTDVTASGPSFPTFQDDQDTSSSVISTDMVVGMRVFFF